MIGEKFVFALSLTVPDIRFIRARQYLLARHIRSLPPLRLCSSRSFSRTAHLSSRCDLAFYKSSNPTRYSHGIAKTLPEYAFYSTCFRVPWLLVHDSTYYNLCAITACLLKFAPYWQRPFHQPPPAIQHLSPRWTRLLIQKPLPRRRNRPYDLDDQRHPTPSRHDL